MLLKPYLTEKYFLIEEIKRYYRRVVETVSKAIEANIYYYLDFQTMKFTVIAKK